MPPEDSACLQLVVSAALREVLNHAWKTDHKIRYNPVYAASDLLEPE